MMIRNRKTGIILICLLAVCLTVTCAQAASVSRTKKYHWVFMVGDSRTMYMKKHVGEQVRKTTFIYKNGGGLTWFKQHGYKRLLKSVRKHRKYAKKTGKPMAVVLNFGVNNLTMAGRYVPYYRSIARKLIKMGCRLFVMSVNPYDPVRARANGYLNIPAAASAVVSFNRTLKAGTKKYYTWINTYDYLMKTGWVTGGGIPGGDGLHYMKPTSEKIYNYMIRAIDAAA